MSPNDQDLKSLGVVPQRDKVVRFFAEGVLKDKDALASSDLIRHVLSQLVFGQDDVVELIYGYPFPIWDGTEIDVRGPVSAENVYDVLDTLVDIPRSGEDMMKPIVTFFIEVARSLNPGVEDSAKNSAKWFRGRPLLLSLGGLQLVSSSSSPAEMYQALMQTQLFIFWCRDESEKWELHVHPGPLSRRDEFIVSACVSELTKLYPCTKYFPHDNAKLASVTHYANFVLRNARQREMRSDSDVLRAVQSYTYVVQAFQDCAGFATAVFNGTPHKMLIDYVKNPNFESSQIRAAVDSAYGHGRDIQDVVDHQICDDVRCHKVRNDTLSVVFGTVNHFYGAEVNTNLLMSVLEKMIADKMRTGVRRETFPFAATVGHHHHGDSMDGFDIAPLKKWFARGKNRRGFQPTLLGNIVAIHGHANALLIFPADDGDLKGEWICEHFEPHLGHENVEESFVDRLQRFLDAVGTELGITIRLKTKVCPVQPKIFQSAIAADSPFINTCVLWSLWFLYVRATNPNGISYEEFYSMWEKQEGVTDFENFISDFAIKMLDQMTLSDFRGECNIRTYVYTVDHLVVGESVVSDEIMKRLYELVRFHKVYNAQRIVEYSDAKKDLMPVGSGRGIKEDCLSPVNCRKTLDASTTLAAGGFGVVQQSGERAFKLIRDRVGCASASVEFRAMQTVWRAFQNAKALPGVSAPLHRALARLQPIKPEFQWEEAYTHQGVNFSCALVTSLARGAPLKAMRRINRVGIPESALKLYPRVLVLPSYDYTSKINTMNIDEPLSQSNPPRYFVISISDAKKLYPTIDFEKEFPFMNGVLFAVMTFIAKLVLRDVEIVLGDPSDPNIHIMDFGMVTPIRETLPEKMAAEICDLGSPFYTKDTFPHDIDSPSFLHFMDGFKTMARAIGIKEDFLMKLTQGIRDSM